MGSSCMQAQGLVVNEVSNGPSGSKEYIELVAVGMSGQSCATIDIRGWFLDDNNGDFSCGPIASAGIAAGHIRFRTTGPWSAIPIGSILVIYNAADLNALMPADDPYDANGDSVYIIPSTNTDLEVSNGTSTCPGGSLIPMGCDVCPGGGSEAYSPATYTFGGSWNNVGLRNSGDAGQTRDATGAYFHGLSWGTGSSNINGGPDNLQIGSTDGGAKNYYFNSGDYRTAANFSVGAAPTNETPGAPNNAANDAWIDGWRCPTGLLPMVLNDFMAWSADQHVVLHWETSREDNTHSFLVERWTTADEGFTLVGRIAAAGFSSSLLQYDFHDEHPVEGLCQYRLRLVDADGGESTSEVRHVQWSPAGHQFSIYPVPSSHEVQLLSSRAGEAHVKIYDAQGRLQHEAVLLAGVELNLDVRQWPQGIYLCQFRHEDGTEKTARLFVNR